MALAQQPALAPALVLPSLSELISRADVSMLSGAVGGPLVVGTLTPQRNAMTLAAKDTASTYLGLYRQVFSRGFLGGFRGASRPMVAAVPQFTAIGPVYLITERESGSAAAAVLSASVVESLCTFAAHRRNAQIQFNATRACASEHLAYQPLHRLAGPGFVPHVLRNVTAVMGIRLFAPHSLEVVRRMPGADSLGEEGKLVTADLASSVVSGTLSMPFNHAFSWCACTPELQGRSWAGRAWASAEFLVSTYKTQGVKLLARDLAVRISYVSLLMTGYRAVERRFQGYCDA